jgi:hypothetical protein
LSHKEAITSGIINSDEGSQGRVPEVICHILRGLIGIAHIPCTEQWWCDVVDVLLEQYAHIRCVVARLACLEAVVAVLNIINNSEIFGWVALVGCRVDKWLLTIPECSIDHNRKINVDLLL